VSLGILAFSLLILDIELIEESETLEEHVEEDFLLLNKLLALDVILMTFSEVRELDCDLEDTDEADFEYPESLLFLIIKSKPSIYTNIYNTNFKCVETHV
jgi:hypothetical protein